MRECSQLCQIHYKPLKWTVQYTCLQGVARRCYIIICPDNEKFCSKLDKPILAARNLCFWLIEEHALASHERCRTFHRHKDNLGTTLIRIRFIKLIAHSPTFHQLLPSFFNLALAGYHERRDLALGCAYRARSTLLSATWAPCKSRINDKGFKFLNFRNSGTSTPSEFRDRRYQP